MLYKNRYSPPDNDIKNIVAWAYGDINGDNIPDYVYLTGLKMPNSGFIQDITLIIKDGKTGIKQSTKLESDVGYAPGLFLGDFTGDRINEIYISIASGGSGGIMFYYMFSDVNNQIKMIFNYEDFNNKYNYNVEYRDNYQVMVKNLELGTKYVIDITYKDKAYIDEIYTPEGKLKEAIEGWVDPISGLYPVDFDGDGVYELLGYQKILGRYHADSLGYVQSALNWNGKKFYMMDQYVAIFGTSPEEVN